MPYIGQRPSKGDENNFKILDDISSYTLTFDGSDASVVSAANDTITSLNHRFAQGQRVTYNKGGGSVIAGLSDGVYYIIKHDHHTIKLATSASNATNGIAVNITGVGGGSSHTLNVAFDGINTKFKATHTNGQKAKITRSAQLVISINGVIQQPHDSATPSTGFGFDLDGTIVLSQAPVAGDVYWAHVLTNNNVTFDISDNDVDNFTGDGSTVSFNLSKTPPDNRNILVTIDGVVQYPNDPDGTARAYNVVENVLTFTTAPDANVEIQVRHIGFAGSTSGGGGGVTNFYGRTGAVVLKNTDNIVANNAEFAGNLTVQGTMTTLDTKVTEVDQLEVAANNTTVGVAITQSGTGDILNLYDGSSEVFSVTDGGNTFLTGSLTSTGSHLRVVDKNNGGQILIGNNNDLVLKHESNNSYIAHNGSGDLYLETLGSSEDIYVRSTGTQRFSTAGVERVQIASNGRVGILTVTPEARLDVYDTSGLGILSRSAATQATDTNKALKVRNNSTTDTFNVSYKGQGYFAGKVGIGTVTPGRELTIYSPDSGSTYLNLTNATTGAGSNSGFALGLGGDEVARIWQYGASQMEFGTNSTQHMTLASTGQLGIGTDYDTSATAKKLTLVLDSVGDGIHIGNKESLYPAASTGYSDIRFTFRDYLTGGFTNGGEAIVRGYNENAYATQRRTALIFMTSSSATSGNATGDATEKFRITSYGSLEHKAYGGYNKLITQRTDAASSNNDIFFQLLAKNTGGVEVGSLSFQRESAADDAYLAFNTRNTGGSLGERLRIESDGAVNIGHNPSQSTGTNTQNAILTIKGYPGGNESSAAILALIRGYNTTSATTDHTIGRIVFGDKQAGEYAFIEGEVEANGGSVGDTPGRLVFSTAPDGTSAPTEKLRITSSGKVGINITDNTTADLHVRTGSNGAGIFRLGGGTGGGTGLDMTYSNSGATKTIIKQNYRSTNSGAELSFDSGFITFVTGTTGNDERLRILSDGTIRGGSQVAAQPSSTVAGFQFDAGGGYFRLSKGGGATGTSGAGMSLRGGGSNTNHLATTSWGSNIYLINTNLTDNNANALVFANKNSLASSMIIGKNDSHASRNGSLIFATSQGSSPTQRMRITKEGSINIGTDSTQSTHMLYMQGTGDVGIHLRADTDNSGENDNPYVSMAQDGGNTQAFKLGMAGDANTAFNMQLANSPFVHANNANSQPLQFAHMTDMAVTISNVPTLAATGQSATDPRDFDSNGSLSGSAVGGMKIHKYGNNTAAALMLSGHNNTGTPGTETRTQLTHDGANLKFHIEHHGYESFNISPVGNIYLKNCTTVPSFTTSYNVSALSLKGGSIMNFEDSNFYVLQNLHYDGAWKNTYSGAGSMFSQNGGNGRYYYFDDPGSAGQSVSLINSVQFSNQSSASGLSYGNRPGHQGQLIIWGPSHATQKGGIEFHTSGGGGGGYGGRITCSDVGHVRILTRNNSSVWSEKFTVSGTSNEAQASNFGTGGYYRSSGPGGGAGIKMMGLAAGSGNNAVDTGISINASNGGRTMLVLGSRNTGAGDSTQSYLWLLRFKYDGNNLPQEFNINGNSSFWSVSKSGSNTLVLNGNSGNWQFGGIWVN